MSIHERPYGVGLAYRYHLHEEVMHFGGEIDLLEIPTEDHILRRRALSYPGAAEKFAQCLEHFPCVAHGISMSVGSVEPLEESHFKSTRKFLDQSGIQIFSEHLAFHRMDGTDIASFLGMPLTDVSLDWLERSYAAAKKLMGGPFALENVSLSFPVPDAQYSEPEFLTQFLNRTDATLLLDVTNLFNNCTNYGMDPVEFLHGLPADRVSQIHLAGGHYDDNGFLIDSHSFAVMDEVWDLFRETVKYTNAEIVILERDYQCFPFREVMDDLRKAREIFYDIRPQTAPALTPTEPFTMSAPSADDTAPEFSNLRSFQQAIIHSITDDDFRAKTAVSPAAVQNMFPMEDVWQQRFAGCEKLDDMSENWKETDRLNREDEERFRQWEWSQWAQAEATAGNVATQS